MSLFPRPSLPELDRRIAATLAELQHANGEAYTELLGTLAYLRAMRAQVEKEEAEEARLIVEHDICGPGADIYLAQLMQARTLPPEPTSSKGY